LKLPTLCAATLLLMALAITGCSPKDSAPSAAAPAPAKRAVSLEAIAAGAKGFTVGAMMSTNTVYVFFDAQCPHCGHLWEASAPLLKKVKFVWIPVGLINATSTAQGAALMTAANPAELMSEHERSLLAGKGGISASSSLPAGTEQAIKANTQLWTSFGAEAVPYVVAKNMKTGQVVTKEGSMPTAVLADFLGVDAP
jgi:thiol:disulfide interchange protein DsbG